jgi:hypothetical protein
MLGRLQKIQNDLLQMYKDLADEEIGDDLSAEMRERMCGYLDIAMVQVGYAMEDVDGQYEANEIDSETTDDFYDCGGY